ncbi:MAG: hypothetical protein ABI661_10730 [Gammaproteobacteria bacterium]
MQQRNVGLRAGLIVVIAAVAMLTGPAAGADDTRLERLSPGNRLLAQRMLASVARWDRKYRDRAVALNGGPSAAESRPESLHRETDYSIYDVWVTRGPVIEKLGGMLAEAKQQQPGRTGSPLVWSRFYSLDYHPKSPLVGMLHSAIVLQFYENGTGFVGGWLGVMNGTRNEQDMAQLAKVVDDRFAKFGTTPGLYRQLMLKGPDKADPNYLRRPDPSGVSLYGPPLFPGDTARSYELAEGLFEQVNDAYLEIVARRAPQSYTPDDEARRDDMRKRWLTDQLFADPFSSKVVPFEVWSLSDMPPVIRF